MKRITKFGLFIVALSCATLVSSQNNIPLIGQKAPSFTAKTTNGKIHFPQDFGDNWKILLSHPGDFTPVCTSEILQLARMQEDFAALGVKLAIISTDDVSRHSLWKKSIEEIEEENNEPVTINFPFIDDKEIKISKKYGMIHHTASTKKDIRGVFIIDPDNIIQSVNFYPMKIGRNMEEIKRTVIALQTVNEAQVLTPVNWNPGDDVLLPFSPYPNQELEENPELKKQYYNIGTIMWYKKALD